MLQSIFDNHEIILTHKFDNFHMRSYEIVIRGAKMQIEKCIELMVMLGRKDNATNAYVRDERYCKTHMCVIKTVRINQK
jgi:hypothetical protein